MADACQCKPMSHRDALRQGPRRRRHDALIRVKGDEVTVEETQDYWVIPDTGLTAEGVMNWGLKTRESLAKTWMLANGIPFTHDHPRDADEEGLVIDMRRVAGFMDNVRFQDEGDGPAAVVGDVYLARRSQEGLAVSDAMIRSSERLVASIRAHGEEEVSIGFWATDEWAPGVHDGVEYEFKQHDIVYDHVASVPLGACPWGGGCGLGRHQNMVGAARGGEAKPLNARRVVAGREASMTGDPESDAVTDDGEAGDASPEKPQGDAKATDGDAKLLLERVRRLEADAAQRTKALLDGKRGELAKLLDCKAEALPEDLSETALDAWIKREKSRPPGRRDPALVTGDGRRASSLKMNEAVNGVTMTPHGLTITDWGAAEAHAAKAQGGGWLPIDAPKEVTPHA